ncbi:hypothetical protein L226DRAFT_241662 [Lentinus tigrinus ALCF2SS1-7]|uniref:uncharacterized protein n=1 Tax=Lentinus tigrinus ALCF2SS1-7 TaxID=1328758 RepID=UPI001165FD7C|nr:hypothetical protein L226DRAFT_241662 [Lentinus tigrinus ALCF2SS1-7]
MPRVSCCILCMHFPLAMSATGNTRPCRYGPKQIESSVPQAWSNIPHSSCSLLGDSLGRVLLTQPATRNRLSPSKSSLEEANFCWSPSRPANGLTTRGCPASRIDYRYFCCEVSPCGAVQLRNRVEREALQWRRSRVAITGTCTSTCTRASMRDTERAWDKGIPSLFHRAQLVIIYDAAHTKYYALPGAQCDDTLYVLRLSSPLSYVGNESYHDCQQGRLMLTTL